MPLPLPRDDSRFETNMTPMIDIIFQLLIFFMCATKFRALDGKLESYLPQKGESAEPKDIVKYEERRIVLRHDPATGVTHMRVGEQDLLSEADLDRYVVQPIHEFRRVGWKASVLLDSDPQVPVQAVVWTLNACVRGGIVDVEFASQAD